MYFFDRTFFQFVCRELLDDARYAEVDGCEVDEQVVCRDLDLRIQDDIFFFEYLFEETTRR